MRGAIAVVGGSGVLVSASRMDGAGAGGMGRAVSKAWIAATQKTRSTEHLQRMTTLPAPIAQGFLAVSPEAEFPGAGGMPLARADGEIEGGISASGSTVGPFVDYPGAVKEKLIVDGQPANCEDLLVHYAIDRPYVGQHGDDMARWVAAYGDFPADAGPGLGMTEPPPPSRQDELDWARALADHALAAARERGLKLAVVVCDQRGEPIQQDWMNGAPTAAVEVARALAATAGTFQFPSQDLDDRFKGPNLRLLAAALPFRVLGIEGGQPLGEQGGIGIAGPPPHVCAEIAASIAG